MIDFMPKITDLKDLKGLSKIIVLPLICASYIVQTQYSLVFPFGILEVNNDAIFWIQLFQTIGIFAGKALFAGIITGILGNAILYAHVYTKENVIPLVVLLLLSFGFVGLFASDKLPLISDLKPIWFYSVFVVSFYLLSIQDEWDSI